MAAAGALDLDLKPKCAYLFVGKSKIGKSHLMEYIVKRMYHEGKFKFGLCFTGTKFNSGYDWLPDKYVYEGYSEGRLQQYVKSLETTIKTKGKVDASFIILDDLVGLLESNTNWFSNFISTYRHLNCTVLIAVQYLNKNIPPTIRENIDYAFMFFSQTKLTQDALYHAFGGLFPKRQDFINCFHSGTQGAYNALVYLASEKSIDSNYYIYRAPADKIKLKIDWTKSKKPNQPPLPDHKQD